MGGGGGAISKSHVKCIMVLSVPELNRTFYRLLLKPSQHNRDFLLRAIAYQHKNCFHSAPRCILIRVT